MLTSDLELSASVVRALCDTHFGIGGDGLLVIRSAEITDQELPHDQALYEMVVHNADGSLAEMCGNGLRCVVKYLHARGLMCVQGQRDYINTGAGPLMVSVNAQGDVGVHMGWPRVEAPLTLSGGADGGEVTLPAYSLGNPHIVTFDQAHMSDRSHLGPDWSSGVMGGVNVSFARLVTSELIELYVHERGCGWTLACGTGACATVFDAYQRGDLTQDKPIEVQLPGGALSFEIDHSGLMMWGPAREVYQGVYLSPAEERD